MGNSIKKFKIDNMIEWGIFSSALSDNHSMIAFGTNEYKSDEYKM